MGASNQTLPFQQLSSVESCYENHSLAKKEFILDSTLLELVPLFVLDIVELYQAAKYKQNEDGIFDIIDDPDTGKVWIR